MFCSILIYIKGYVRLLCWCKVRVTFDCSSFAWVCCIMIVLVDVSCCIIMGRFTYVSNCFIVFLCASSIMLRYEIHWGPSCIATSLKCYVALQHSWRPILHCNIFAWWRCIMVMFINWFYWIMRFICNVFVGF